MANENSENFDQEDRDFYSEGQRPDSDTAEKRNSEQENKDNSLQNDFYRDPDNVDSDNNPNRRTLDEYDATTNEPNSDNGLENNVRNDDTFDTNSDPLESDNFDDNNFDDDNFDNEDSDDYVDSDDIDDNSDDDLLKDAFNNDDYYRKD